MSKSMLLIEEPKNCVECRLRCWGIGGWSCIGTKRLLEGPIAEREEWCPLKPVHALKSAGKDYVIYERQYLYDNLEREMELIKKARDYESSISN